MILKLVKVYNLLVKMTLMIQLCTYIYRICIALIFHEQQFINDYTNLSLFILKFINEL